MADRLQSINKRKGLNRNRHNTILTSTPVKVLVKDGKDKSKKQVVVILALNENNR